MSAQPVLTSALCCLLVWLLTSDIRQAPRPTTVHDLGASDSGGETSSAAETTINIPGQSGKMTVTGISGSVVKVIMDALREADSSGNAVSTSWASEHSFNTDAGQSFIFSPAVQFQVLSVTVGNGTVKFSIEVDNWARCTGENCKEGSTNQTWAHAKYFIRVFASMIIFSQVVVILKYAVTIFNACKDRAKARWMMYFDWKEKERVEHLYEEIILLHETMKLFPQAKAPTVPRHILDQILDLNAELKQDLECPACLEVLTKDNYEVFYECGHNICSACAPKLTVVEKNGNYTKHKCPICRKVSSVSK